MGFVVLETISTGASRVGVSLVSWRERKFLRMQAPMRSTTRVAKRKNNLLALCFGGVGQQRGGVQPFARNACTRGARTLPRASHTNCTYNESPSPTTTPSQRDILKTRLAIGANYTLSTLSFARPHVAAFAYVRRTHTLAMQAISQNATRTQIQQAQDGERT